MKPINANTKIAHLLKAHPEALETIISINPKFEKLRNPFLRKLLTGRTSISMASKMAGVKVEDFYCKLEPLGFEIDRDTKEIKNIKKPLPSFITAIGKDQIVDFDVRQLLEEGKDPLSQIITKIKVLPQGSALKVINTFEPLPLIKMMEKQGFDVYADIIDNTLVETYIFKKYDTNAVEVKPKDGANSGWDELLVQYGDNLVTVDVRELEMPQPMMTILENLETLPPEKALFVYHKRIPVFLLPELTERNMDYRIKEISEGEVHLLIFNN